MQGMAEAVRAVAVVARVGDELVVSCTDYDEYRALPAALRFEGQLYGRTGWNSDRGQAYYRAGHKVAFPVEGAR